MLVQRPFQGKINDDSFIKGQMLRQLLLRPKNIFRFIQPVHVHLKVDKVDLKKKATVKKKLFCILFQSTHQVDMKNGVKCYKDFFGYFNALKTHCDAMRIQYGLKKIVKQHSNFPLIKKKRHPAQLVFQSIEIAKKKSL